MIFMATLSAGGGRTPPLGANPTHGDATALTHVTAERGAQADSAAMSIEEPRGDASAESVAPGEGQESAWPTWQAQGDAFSWAILAGRAIGGADIAGATHAAGAAPLVGTPLRERCEATRCARDGEGHMCGPLARTSTALRSQRRME